jgi:hypothetical protein
MTTSEGKKVLLRTVLKYSSDWSSFAATTKASPDNGKTWKLWYKDEGRKVKTARDKAKGNSIEGMWDLEQSKYGDSLDDMKEWRSLKVFQNGTFVCASYDRETGKVQRTHGGTYSFDGKTLKETLTFVGGEDMQEMLGQSFTFDIAIKDGKIHQSGQLVDTELSEV